MNLRMIGVLAATGALVAVSPAAAQSRPDVDFSESSNRSGPTCIVGGSASDCAGGAPSAFPVGLGVGAPVAPIFVNPSPVLTPLIGGVFGGDTSGEVTSNVDVDRSTSPGLAAAR